jgi:hypothetical protein
MTVDAGQTKICAPIVPDRALRALLRRKQTKPIARIRMLAPMETPTPIPTAIVWVARWCELEPALRSPVTAAEGLAYPVVATEDEYNVLHVLGGMLDIVSLDRLPWVVVRLADTEDPKLQ